MYVPSPTSSIPPTIVLFLPLPPPPPFHLLHRHCSSLSISWNYKLSIDFINLDVSSVVGVYHLAFGSLVRFVASCLSLVSTWMFELLQRNVCQWVMILQATWYSRDSSRPLLYLDIVVTTISSHFRSIDFTKRSIYRLGYLLTIVLFSLLFIAVLPPRPLASLFIVVFLRTSVTPFGVQQSLLCSNFSFLIIVTSPRWNSCKWVMIFQLPRDNFVG